MQKTVKSHRPVIHLDKISEEDLLNCRVCDLPLSMEGTWLKGCVDELYAELDARHIVFRPQCYLADEWMTPEGETVIGIPFYLAHPALMRLENKMMREVEGGTKEWCMKLLRHEAGHALTYAYRLNKRKKWRQLFGSSSVEYKETYRFRPYSKNYVNHLGDYYAQYHPDEDFVETFAVWLTPNSNWEEKYKGWKRALRKLQYVDQLMKEIAGKEPPVKNASKEWRLSTLKATLRNHYKKRRSVSEEDFPDFHDANLKRIFAEIVPENAKNMKAVQLIVKNRKDMVNTIHFWTREKKYIIYSLLKVIGQRCRALKLVINDPEQVAVLKLSTYITKLVMNYLYTGRFKGEQTKRRK